MADNKRIRGIGKLFEKLLSKSSISKKSEKKDFKTKIKENKKISSDSDYTQSNRKLAELNDIDVSYLGSAKRVYEQIVEILREMNFDGYISQSTMSQFTHLTHVYLDIIESAKGDIARNEGFCNKEEFEQIEQLYEKIKKAREIIGHRYILDSDDIEIRNDRRDTAEVLSNERNKHRMDNIDIR